MKFTIRKLKDTETGILEEMLYNAVFVPPGADKPPYEIVHYPELSVYYRDFSRPGDLCLVAKKKTELQELYGRGFFLKKSGAMALLMNRHLN